MWQIFALGALILGEIEYVADKVIVVSDKAIDSILASFYRNFVYFLLALLVGLTGIVGHIRIFLPWPVLVVAGLSVFSGIFYTYLLKKIEVTGSSAVTYAVPFLFLLVDVFVVKTHMSSLQILGIVLLILGGVGFVMDSQTRKLKPEYTKYIWGIFIFDFIVTGAEFYTFRYYNAVQHLNEVSYMISIWLLVSIGLLALVFFQGKARQLYSTATHKHYLPKITLSKSFDVGSSLLWFHAISLTNISKVTSFDVFSPLILLVLVYITQNVLKFKVDERLDGPSLKQKALATAVLIVGAYLIG